MLNVLNVAFYTPKMEVRKYRSVYVSSLTTGFQDAIPESEGKKASRLQGTKETLLASDPYAG